tara:strand:- start:703 stop:1179 length:477 start_codon:yes stop_codon:yes gene_type:complete
MSETTKTTADIKRIKEMIPHRYPILLIDRVEEIEKSTRAVGVKCVTVNEPFFQGHFPDMPVMPGVLIVEAMAQTSAVLVVDTLGKEFEGKLVYFMTIDNARFRNPVVPGDVLKLEVTVVRSRGMVWKFDGKATVDGKLCAEATFSAMIIDNPDEKKKA